MASIMPYYNDSAILVLHALGTGLGDEVITTPNSFTASSGCTSWVDARPVFVDIKGDYNKPRLDWG